PLHIDFRLQANVPVVLLLKPRGIQGPERSSEEHSKQHATGGDLACDRRQPPCELQGADWNYVVSAAGLFRVASILFVLHLVAKLLRVPPTFLRGSFGLCGLFQGVCGGDSLDMSGGIPKEGVYGCPATRSERDDPDPPVFGAFDTGHESPTVETVNRNT